MPEINTVPQSKIKRHQYGNAFLEKYHVRSFFIGFIFSIESFRLERDVVKIACLLICFHIILCKSTNKIQLSKKFCLFFASDSTFDTQTYFFCKHTVHFRLTKIKDYTMMVTITY